MPAMTVVDTGIVYRNALPHLRSRHGYFPTLVELDGGELLVGLDIGTAFEAIDVRSYACRSTDGGVNWSEPELLFEPDESRHPVSTSCRLSKLRDGSLIGWASLFNRTRTDVGLANTKTEGFCKTEFATIRSSDRGRTWSPPQQVQLPTDWQEFEICAPPFQTSSQRLLVVTRPFFDWEGEVSPWGQDGMAFCSDDGGESWGDMVHVFGGSADQLSANEQALTRLSDGRLISMCWTIDHHTGKSLANRIAFSEDDGESFTGQRSTPLLGETCRPLGLAENRVLVVYRRTDKKGLWVQLAKLEGEQWTPLEDQLLWGGEVTSHRTDLDSKLAQMSTLKFGCPAITRLENGDVFVVFWCVEDCQSVIRWFRMQVEG